MFARTDRLLLRPGWAEDAASLQATIADEGIVSRLARAPWPYTLADAEAFLALPPDPVLPNMLVFARTRGAPRMVGGCSLFRANSGTVELGYWIARPFWGLGYATEAAGALLRIADAVGIDVVEAAPFVDNPGSAHVLAKLGFRRTGAVEPHPCLARGREVPAMRMVRAAGCWPTIESEQLAA